MFVKNYKTYLLLVFLVLIDYGLHQLSFYLFNINQELFYYSLEKLYAIFFGLTFVVITILLIIEKRNFDQVGMSFLLVTTFKMGIYYLLLKPILEIKHHDITIEKRNFFVMFILFLTIETIVTIRILSKKA